MSQSEKKTEKSQRENKSKNISRRLNGALSNSIERTLEKTIVKAKQNRDKSKKTSSWTRAHRSVDHGLTPPFGFRLFKELEPLKPKEGVHTLTTVGQYVWGGGLDGTLTIWDARTGRNLGSRQAHKGRIFAMFLVNNHVWTAADDNKVKIWNLHGSLAQDLLLFNGRVACASHFGDEVWFGFLGSCIRIVDTKTLTVKKDIDLKKVVRHIFKHKDLVWICTDEHITRINVKTHIIVDVLDQGRVNHLVYAGNNRVWGASSDSSITVWDAETGKQITTCGGHTGHVFSLLAAGGFVWSGGWDGKILVWDATTMKTERTLELDKDVVSAIILVPVKAVVSDDEAHKEIEIFTVWSAAWDGNVCVWL
mmetsp:Transcript_4072/g.4490  ORF Transcript_4072/g.4490 Transcript_4072/m.4490 type:complete len:364 (+) Transcript_4072:29-1120(+)